MRYERNDKIITVANFDSYKKPLLFIGEGNKLEAVASFRNKQQADAFINHFKQFMEGAK